MSISLNKNQKVMAVIGGLAGVAVLACLFLGYQASSAQDEAQQKLDAAKSLFDQNNKASKAQKDAIVRNSTEIAAWTEATLESLRAYGDGVDAQTAADDSATFTKSVKSKVDRYLKSIHAGAVEETGLPKPFSDLTSGPEETLALRKRQWCDIQRIVDTFVEAKAENLDTIEIVTAPAPVEEPKKSTRGRGGSKNAPVIKDHFARQSYVFRFTASPEALVKILNTLETGKPFQSVDELSIKVATGKDVASDALKEVLVKRKQFADKKAKLASAAKEAVPVSEEADELAEESTRADTIDLGEYQKAEKQRWASKPGHKGLNPPFSVMMKVTTHVVVDHSLKED